jgi:hypothetical protein
VLGGLDIGIVDFSVNGCPKAVDLLKKRDIGNAATVGDGQNRANDAAYGMAAQLIAAEANVAAGATTCSPNAPTAIARAKALLDHALIQFDGTGAFLPPRPGDSTLSLSNYNAVRQYALALAGVLDNYNNTHEGPCAVPAPPAVVNPI